MFKLIMIADDITGAMDTGIKFAECGVASQLMIYPEVDFTAIKEDTEVLIVDSESRHIKPDEAYAILFKLVAQACQNGVKYVYKKTDSALRGNLSSELAGVIDALKTQGYENPSVEFVPALPENGRTTYMGKHYIKGVPLTETAIGKDPFDPVVSDYIPDILNKDRKLKCRTVKKYENAPDVTEACVNIYDADSKEDIRWRAGELAKKNRLGVMAGCAGLASYLQEELKLKTSEKNLPAKTERLVILSGTLNETTKKQIDYAADRGFQRVILTEKQKWEEDYFSSLEGICFLELLKEKCEMDIPLMIDVFESKDGKKDSKKPVIRTDNRQGVAERVAEIGEMLSAFDRNITFLMTGGDTTAEFLKKTRCCEVTLIQEILPGLVLFRAETLNGRIQIVSKAGGLGSTDAFIKVFEKLNQN